MRNVWNLRPAHIADQITKIELIHAKSSDFAAYEPRAVDFDPRTFTYDLDPAFDHVAWQYELERIKHDRSSLTPAQQNDVLKQRNENMRQKVKEYVTSKGCLFKSELEEWMRAQGFAKNVAQSIYSGMIKSGDLAKVTENLTNRVFVGTPAVIAKILAESPPETYRLR